VKISSMAAVKVGRQYLSIIMIIDHFGFSSIDFFVGNGNRFGSEQDCLNICAA
jgi:hypothetical protein